MIRNIPENAENIRLTCANVNLTGEGITRYEGKVVFVPGFLPGETAEIKITENKKRFARGEIIRLLTSSSKRQIPHCGLFGSCGGCSWQHMTYGDVLRVKERAVADALERIGDVDAEIIRNKRLPIVGADAPCYYRNHVQFKIGSMRENGSIELGFFAPQSHRVVTGEPCLLVPKTLYPIWNIFQKYLQKAFADAAFESENRWKEFYEHLSGVIWRIGDLEQKHLINLQGEFDNNTELTSIISEENIRQVVKMSNAEMESKHGQSIAGVLINDRILYGDDFVMEYIGEKKYRVSAGAFFQVNNAQAERLFDAIRSRILSAKDGLNIRHNDKIPHGLDLYCGSGPIGIYVADLFEHMRGVEINPDSIRDAKLNAKINDTTNISFTCGKAEKYTNELDINVLIVDPPRKGLDNSLVEQINRSDIPYVLYVSCNPATLARDLKAMKRFSIQSWQSFDLFPWCGHVECVCLLSRK